MQRRTFITLTLVVLLALPVPTVFAQRTGRWTNVELPKFARDAAESITERQLKAYLYFVASNEMEGRDTPSRGLDIVANFLAMNLALLGLQPAGDDGTYFQSFRVEGDRLAYGGSSSRRTSNTQNVVAILEGSDPSLKNEYVGIGAHYDHLGTHNGMIFNGADDDGSGVVAILSMAEAFTHMQRPKRSIMFIWHAGEEKGRLGSQYFTQNPTIPLVRMVAYVNIDMIGKSKRPGDMNPENDYLTGPNEIHIVGPRILSTDLEELTDNVNKHYLNLTFNHRRDDINEQSGGLFRSDHFSYLQKGIPVMHFNSGQNEDYHRPSDTPDKIDYLKMEKVARTIFLITWALANAPGKPRIDKPLPPRLIQTEQ